MFRTEAGSIEVVVEMGRQILGMVLTMYLPTSLMNIIGKIFFLSIFCFYYLSHRTQYKLHETLLLWSSGTKNASILFWIYVASQVSVNLTVMLVLTTMFSSINALLPKTSYMKMSDIWFIFNLILPFLEVCILVRKETLRLDNAPINHHGKASPELFLFKYKCWLYM